MIDEIITLNKNDILFQNGDTPLHIAVALNRQHLVRLLLDNGASAFIRNMVSSYSILLVEKNYV